MARDFSKNTSNFLSLGAAAVGPLLAGGSGLSVGFWCNPDTFGANSTDGDDCLHVNHTSTSAILFRFGQNSQAAGLGSMTFRRVGADTLSERRGSAAWVTGSWQHVLGVVAFGSGPDLYKNGALNNGTLVSGVATTAGTFTHSASTTHDAIGAAFSGSTPISTARQFDGRIAEVGIWAGALGAADAAALANGFSPLLVRPDLLRVYMPLVGAYSPERDRRGGLTGTITGTVAAADHVRVIQPRGRVSVFVPAAGGAFQPAWARRSNQILLGGVG